MSKDTRIWDRCPSQANKYRIKIDEMLKEEQDVLSTIRDEDPEAAFKRLELTDMMLNIASNFIVINGICLIVHKSKNEDILNEARKVIYKSIIYLEAVVSSYIDSPYSDYEKRLAVIEEITPAKRYFLVRKMGLAINLLRNAYGDNTKWKWTFVEIEGRYTAVAKNIINLRDVVVNSSMDSPHYEPTVRHLTLIKKLLSQAADRYREKYELSTGRIDDFKMAINFLSALRRIHIITGDQAEAVTMKKKLDTWNVKLAADMEKIEKEKKEKKN